MVEPFLVVCGLLLLGSVLARAMPVARRSFDDDHEDGWDLSPRELAYLRSGPYGVVLTVLAELHGEGAVDLSRPGPVRRLDPPGDVDDRLTVAVYSGLVWSRRPRLLAALPRVRRACTPLRTDLRERSLLPPVRRKVFAAALRVYAVGLAVATVVEDQARGSTVVAALGVGAVAAILTGPHRTVAGLRELVEHRAALRRVAADGLGEAAYLSDLVAAYGLGALRVLCGEYVAVGALAPPTPTYEPPLPVPASAPVRRPLAVPKPRPARLPEVATTALTVTASTVRASIFVPVEPPVAPESAVLRSRVELAA